MTNLAQIFDAYYRLFQLPAFGNASRPAGDLSYADQYINDIFTPLFNLFHNNAAKQASTNGAFDAGLWTAPKNAGSPGMVSQVAAQSLRKSLRRLMGTEDLEYAADEFDF